MSPRASEDADLGSGGGWAEGLAKGVFTHKRSKKRSHSLSARKSQRKPNKRRRLDTHTDRAMDQYLEQCLASREPVWAKERAELHDKIVGEVEERVETIQQKIFKDVYDSLVTFVEASQKLTQTTIPTAVLLTGVNMPDHSKVFGHIIDRLKHITPHISLLSSGQTFRQLVTSLVLDLVNVQDDDDDDTEVSIVKKSEASFSFLKEWYSNQYPSEERPPLVLVIQDFENCSGSSLKDLITLCNRYLDCLPIVMIFGVATTISAVHKSLPQSTTSKLTINTFGSPVASLHLEEVIESIIIDPEIPFKLSSKVLGFLIEDFLFHDFSVNHFLSGYRFILGEHFYRTPAALLMRGEEDLINLVNKMDLEELSHICTLQSFRNHVETLTIEMQAETLVNTELCRQTIVNLIQDYFVNMKTFTVMTKVLHILARDLPRHPLGRLQRDIYQAALGGKLETTAPYRECFQFLKLSNRTDLENKLNLIIQEVENFPLLVSFREQLVDSLNKMKEMGAEGESCTGSPVVQSLAAKFSSSSSSSPAVLPGSLDTSGITPLQSKTSTPTVASNATPQLRGGSSSTPAGSAVNSPSLGRFSSKLQASLLEAARRNQMLQRPFDRLRNELMTALHENLKKFLVSPVTLPLHEIFFFTSTGAVRRHLSGAPRAALHTALTDPYAYLGHKDLKIADAGEIPASLPDISVGYKLHLECPRLINVFDWLSCWHSIIKGGEESISQEDQARFSRVVSELHHLGFIKTSTRKTDHVSRLTFGGS